MNEFSGQPVDDLIEPPLKRPPAANDAGEKPRFVLPPNVRFAV